MTQSSWHSLVSSGFEGSNPLLMTDSHATVKCPALVEALLCLDALNDTRLWDVYI
jgi:hypothetical protein